MSKNAFNKLNSKLSSYNVINPKRMMPTSFLNKIINKSLNRYTLNSIAALYPEFTKPKFEQQLLNNYIEMRNSINHKNKGTLANIVSYPLFEFISKNIDNKMKLPFKLDIDAKSCEIVGARLLRKDKLNPKPFNTWYQITVRFSDGGTGEQIMVVERKENDKTAHNWHIAYVQQSSK